METPPLFNSVEDECLYWKERAKIHNEWDDVKIEYDDNFEESREMEDEMDATLDQNTSTIQDHRFNLTFLEKENKSLKSPTGSQSTGSEGGKKARRKQKSYRKKVESVWPHESIIKLIEEIEVRQSLWDAGCAAYKLPKDILWQEVADAIQVSVNDCKGKWSNLRTTFNCNLEKYRRKKCGLGTEENFQIVWRYFKPMMFLETRKVRQTTRSISSMQLESATPDESITCDMGFTNELKSTAPCTSGQQRNVKSSPTMSSTPASSVRKASLNQLAIEALQSLQCCDSQPKDTSTVFGEYIAAELRNLPPELAVFARSKLRRAFNDILDEVALMQQQY